MPLAGIAELVGVGNDSAMVDIEIGVACIPTVITWLGVQRHSNLCHHIVKPFAPVVSQGLHGYFPAGEIR
jgi:hypothetical protein